MIKKIFRHLVLAAWFAACLAQPAALAAQESEEGFSGSLGMTVVTSPEFEGSNRYRVRVLPVMDLSYGPVFLSMGDGLGLNLVPAPGWIIAPTLRYRWARKEKDSDLLRGLGDLKDGVEAGGIIRWQPGPAGLSLKVFQGLGRVDGLTAELGADYGTALTEDLSGSVGLSAVFADRKYNQRYFGITQAQAGKSDYPVYDPGAGLKNVAATASLGYDLTEYLELGLWTQYKRLTGPAADSPLVERGSADQFISAISMTLEF
jgi:outer membrane protein